MFFELPRTFLLPICWLLTWCNLVFSSGKSVRVRASDLMLCWRGLAPSRAAPLCCSNIIQGRNGAADFPTENWSPVVRLCQNMLLPVTSNAPSESQQHEMVGFSPFKMLCFTGWLDTISSIEVRKVFFLCSLIRKSMVGCTVYLPPRHELLNCLLFYFSIIKC